MISQKQNINNYNTLVGFYSSNIAVNKSYLDFNKYIQIAPKELQYKISTLTTDFLNLLVPLNLKNIHISTTSNDSVLFRFSTANKQYDFKFEIFYDYNPQDESDCESILHLYENGVKKDSYFGTRDELYNIVLEIVKECISTYALFKHILLLSFEMAASQGAAKVPVQTYTQTSIPAFDYIGYSDNSLFGKVGRDS
jgi:hypothetical protein